MGGLSPWHLIIIAILLVVLFGGRGRISSLMGDAAKGVKAFRDGLKDDADPHAPPPAAPLPHMPEPKDETRV